MGYIKEVALFFRYKHSKWSQMARMPRKLSMGLAQFCLIGGPPNRRRILLWGVAIGPRRQNSIPQHFFSMACPNTHWYKIKRIFSQVLATDDAFESLCKHPYVSAFLDIHFSAMKKIESQLRDSVPHCTMASLLLEAMTTLNWHQTLDQKRYKIKSGQT